MDETDGVDGGVMPPIPRDPFDELQFTLDIGDGMLYLFCVFFGDGNYRTMDIIIMDLWMACVCVIQK